MEYLVQDDTASAFQTTLTRQDTGAVIPLTGHTVLLKVRKKGTTTVLFTVTGSEDTVGDLLLGIITFNLDANLAALEGFYEAEIEVTYSSGNIESVYELITFQVRGDF